MVSLELLPFLLSARSSLLRFYVGGLSSIYVIDRKSIKIDSIAQKDEQSILKLCLLIEEVQDVIGLAG